MQSHWLPPLLPRWSGSRFKHQAATPIRRYYRMYHRGMALALLLGLFLSMNGFSTALAASLSGSLTSSPLSGPGRHGEARPSGHPHQALTGADAPCYQCGSGPLKPNGGWVQTDPKVFLDFWGPEWKTDTDNIIPTMVAFFNHLAGGDVNNILSQYGVNNDVSLISTSADDIDSTPVPPSLTRTQIANKAASVLAANNIIPDPNTQVMIFPQQGTTYNPNDPYFPTECGEHDFSGEVYYSVIMYASDFNCNFEGGTSAAVVADNMTHTALHEYAETATDPNPFTGWVAANDKEIGDLCNENSFSYQPANGNGQLFFVQELYSNIDDAPNPATNGCVSARGQEYASPASPQQHTVQGAILTEYVNVGQAASVIGPPISEETAMGGGRVSYFTGGCATNYPQGNCAAIYWSSGSGAHFVRGGEYQEYVKVNQAEGALGFPVTNDAAIANGSVTYFNGTCGGSAKCAGIYWSGSTGSHFVRGSEFTEYQRVGEANSVIGFPVTDDAAIANGSVTYFNGTCGGSAKCAGIYWSGSTGSHFVRASEFTEYQHVGEANGPLGFPTSDDTAIPGGSVTYFSANDACGTPGPDSSDGAIYWSGATGSHEVHGCIYAFYQQTMGATGGVLGYPVTDQDWIANAQGANGYVNYFSGGNCGNPGPNGSNSAIYWTGSAAYEVQGCIFMTYINMGGQGSFLGFPITNEYTNAQGYRESDFQYGSIVWKNGSAVIS